MNHCAAGAVVSLLRLQHSVCIHKDLALLVKRAKGADLLDHALALGA